MVSLLHRATIITSPTTEYLHANNMQLYNFQYLKHHEITDVTIKPSSSRNVIGKNAI